MEYVQRQVNPIRKRIANPSEYGVIGPPQWDIDFLDPSMAPFGISHGVRPSHTIQFSKPVSPIVKAGSCNFSGLAGFGFHANNLGLNSAINRTLVIQMLMRDEVIGGRVLSVPWITGSALADGFAFIITQHPGWWEIGLLYGYGGAGVSVTGLKYNVPHTITVSITGNSAVEIVDSRLYSTFIYPGAYKPTIDNYAIFGDILGGGLNMNGKIYRMMFWDRTINVYQYKILYQLLNKRF